MIFDLILGRDDTAVGHEMTDACFPLLNFATWQEMK